MQAGCFIFFDVDDTLVEWTVSWQDVYARAAREVGVVVSSEQAGRVLSAALIEDYEERVRRHARSGDEDRFWMDYDGHVLRLLGVRDRLPQATERVLAMMREPGAMRLYPEVREVLDRLSSAGAKLGIITGRPRAEPDLHRLGVRHYFDPVIDAFAAGSAKSEGRMFAMAAAAAAEAGLPAWHVGDSYQGDIVGAKRAGLRPVLIDRSGEHDGADCLRIRTLRELPRVIFEEVR
jgi:HAD superfamily hydrolase (TIGR01549 family)